MSGNTPFGATTSSTGRLTGTVLLVAAGFAGSAPGVCPSIATIGAGVDAAVGPRNVVRFESLGGEVAPSTTFPAAVAAAGTGRRTTPPAAPAASAPASFRRSRRLLILSLPFEPSWPSRVCSRELSCWTVARSPAISSLSALSCRLSTFMTAS